MTILHTIKKLLGIPPEYEQFDVDIFIAINTVFSELQQMGANPKGFKLITKQETWDEYFQGQPSELDMVTNFIFLKVKKIFDPTSSSVINNTYSEILKELEFRIFLLFN